MDKSSFLSLKPTENVRTRKESVERIETDSSYENLKKIPRESNLVSPGKAYHLHSEKIRNSSSITYNYCAGVWFHMFVTQSFICTESLTDYFAIKRFLVSLSVKVCESHQTFSNPLLLINGPTQAADSSCWILCI